MKGEPAQPVTRRHNQLTPEQEQHARNQINLAIDRLTPDEPLIDRDTARVIAATTHPGAGSYLEHFASTGHLNPRGAQQELRGISGDPPRMPALLLDEYFQAIIEPSPVRRPPSQEEPLPEAFIRSPDTDRADWIPLTLGPTALQNALNALNPVNSDGEPILRSSGRNDWDIGNAVGFHGLNLDPVQSLRQLTRIARGIGRYGEAFAVYVQIFGIKSASPVRFRFVHVGSFDDLTQLLEAFVYTSDALDTNPTRTRHPTPLNLEALEQIIGERFIIQPGPTRIHAFTTSHSHR